MRPWALVLGWCVVAVAFLVESAKPVLRLQLDMATAPANGHVADQVFIDETVDGFGLATARGEERQPGDAAEIAAQFLNAVHVQYRSKQLAFDGKQRIVKHAYDKVLKEKVRPATGWFGAFASAKLSSLVGTVRNSMLHCEYTGGAQLMLMRYDADEDQYVPVFATLPLITEDPDNPEVEEATFHRDADGGLPFVQSRPLRLRPGDYIVAGSTATMRMLNLTDVAGIVRSFARDKSNGDDGDISSNNSSDASLPQLIVDRALERRRQAGSPDREQHPFSVIVGLVTENRAMWTQRPKTTWKTLQSASPSALDTAAGGVLALAAFWMATRWALGNAERALIPPTVTQRLSGAWKHGAKKIVTGTLLSAGAAAGVVHVKQRYPHVNIASILSASKLVPSSGAPALVSATAVPVALSFFIVVLL